MREAENDRESILKMKTNDKLMNKRYSFEGKLIKCNRVIKRMQSDLEKNKGINRGESAAEKNNFKVF